MATIDEKDLILLLRNSDVKAFDLLFYRYYKKVLRFCQNITGSKDDAEETTQIVFQAIWENRTVVEADKPFETYLFAITRHQICNSLKRKAYRRAFIEKLSNPSFTCETDTESEIYFNDLNQLLKKLIDTLPAKRKEIFLLSRNEGLTYKQIAKTLNITENTVDTQIRNTLNYLRPILKNFL